VPREFFDVLVLSPVRKYSTVDLGVERLDAAPEDLGRVRNF
jgi:hypothetical protein